MMFRRHFNIVKHCQSVEANWSICQCDFEPNGYYSNWQTIRFVLNNFFFSLVIHMIVFRTRKKCIFCWVRRAVLQSVNLYIYLFVGCMTNERHCKSDDKLTMTCHQFSLCICWQMLFFVDLNEWYDDVASVYVIYVIVSQVKINGFIFMIQ